MKEEGSLKTKSQVRKSRTRVKTKKVVGSMEEVTEVGEVHGRGHGVDGGTPSPSPSREKEPVKTQEVSSAAKPETKAETKPETKSEVKAESKSKTGNNGKQRSVSRPNGKKASSVPAKPAALKKEPAGNGKKNLTIEEPKAAKASGGKTDTAGDNKKSKVIEGDDFRVTITSNADLVSCEMSDTEEPGSPRKKIIVTPKTPDGKKTEQKRGKQEEQQAVSKKGGKIPIRSTYIKQKVEAPAPPQFPAARPSRKYSQALIIIAPTLLHHSDEIIP